MGTVLFANRYITIYLFGLILVICFILLQILAFYIIKKKRLSDLKFHIFLPIIAFISLLFGKLFYFIFVYYNTTSYLDDFNKWKDFFTFYSFSYDKYGVILGLIIGVYLFYRKNIKFYEVLDIVFLFYTFVMAFISLGLFYSNIGYGTETTLPIGVVLRGLDVEVNNIMVHPVQIYYMIGYLALFIYFFIKYIIRVLSGIIFAYLLMFISVLDFVLSFFVYQCDLILFSLCYNQVLSIITFFGAFLFFLKKFKLNR